MRIRAGTVLQCRIDEKYSPLKLRAIIERDLNRGLHVDEIAQFITKDTGITVSGRTVSRWAKQWAEEDLQKQGAK